MTIASMDTIKPNNIVICRIKDNISKEDDYWDCNVIGTYENFVTVCYLEGYKSRTDNIQYKDIIAKVDQRRKWISLPNNIFKGQFLVFDQLEHS